MWNIILAITTVKAECHDVPTANCSGEFTYPWNCQTNKNIQCACPEKCAEVMGDHNCEWFKEQGCGTSDCQDDPECPKAQAYPYKCIHGLGSICPNSCAANCATSKNNKCFKTCKEWRATPTDAPVVTSTAQAPPTQAPTTQAPTTQAPPTQAPPTQAPPTQAPPTQAPPTQAPPTQAPPTQATSTSTKRVSVECSTDVPGKCNDAYQWNCSNLPQTQRECANTCAKNVSGARTCEFFTGRGKGIYPKYLCSELGSNCATLQKTVNVDDWYGYSPEDSSRKYVGAYTQDSGGKLTVTSAPVLSSAYTPGSLPEVGKSYGMNEYFGMIGKAKLAGVGWTEELMARAMSANARFPNCQAAMKVFSHDNLAVAAGMFADFMNNDDINTNKMELAAMLANSATETMGGTASDPQSTKGFCWNFERSRNQTDYGNQTDPKRCTKIAYPTDKSLDNFGFYGRGGFQLTWCYNYQGFTNFVDTYLGVTKTPETDFYTNPKLVANDYAFVSAVWFWMSPERDGNKPSMHYIVNNWKAGGEVIYDNINRGNDFGYLANIINGAFECSYRAGGGKQNAPANRLSAFSDFADWMSVNKDPYTQYLTVEKGCTGLKDMSESPYKYFIVDGKKVVDGGSTAGETCEDWIVCDSICQTGGSFKVC